MPRIGLRSLGVNLDPIKHLTIEEVFGSGVLAVTECNKKWWKIIKDKGLKIKLDVKGVN